MSIFASGATLLTSGSPGVTWTPVFGDRGTWDTSGSPGYHARDIYSGYFTYHLPDYAETGQAPIWDGYKYVPGYVESSGSGGHGIHQHVEADVLDLLHNATQLQSIPITSGSVADGDYLRYDGTGNEWVYSQPSSGSGGDRVLGLSISGELTIEVIPTRVIAPWTGTINTIVTSVGTGYAPVGSDLIIDVLKNGTSIFTNEENRITVPENELDDLDCIPDITSFEMGDVFTFEVIERGTVVKAAYIVIQMRVSIL